MGFLSDRLTPLASDTRPSISRPLPTPFTPNPTPFERPDTPESKTFGKKRGLRGWMKERSRVFWIVLVLSLLLLAGVGTTVPLFLLRHHPETQTLQTQDAATSPPEMKTSQGTTIDHSFLVDIDTAEDEPTRAAVSKLKIKLTLESTENHPRTGQFRGSVHDIPSNFVADIQWIQN